MLKSTHGVEPKNTTRTIRIMEMKGMNSIVVCLSASRSTSVEAVTVIELYMIGKNLNQTKDTFMVNKQA